eukprot:scaffold129406_cov58-Cyclotella_meneghiniana.AAC.2
MMYYPTHILDDESDPESNCSAEIEGSSYLPQHLEDTNHSTHTANDVVVSASSDTNKRRQYPWEKEEEYGLAVQEDFDAAVDTNGRDQKMAELIQSERNRRLGVSLNSDAFEHDDDDDNNDDDDDRVDDAAATTSERASGGLLGNIKGWFGGGASQSNLNQSERSSLSNSAVSLNNEQSSHSYHPPNSIHNSRRGSVLQHETIHEDKVDNGNNDDDSSSSSSSSSSYSSVSQHSSLDQRTRARHQALRYLSNSCVDTGRKSKTQSYIWGLERLDLKRRRDRFERELGVVEGEMNKDWSSSNRGDDKVAKLA